MGAVGFETDDRHSRHCPRMERLPGGTMGRGHVVAGTFDILCCQQNRREKGTKRPVGVPFSAACVRIALAAGIFLAQSSLSTSADAQTNNKTFIDYFQPTPITCSPPSSATWGVAGVLPRDICNGIESANGAGGAPSYYYWDGSLIRAPDGTYHLFADRWAGSGGFNPGWESSDPIHATSSGGPLGPFTYKAYVYSDTSFGSDPHHGHNSMACTLLDGSYCYVVSEVVPFTLFTSKSLDGPWTPCPGSPGAGLSVPGGFSVATPAMARTSALWCGRTATSKSFSAMG